MKKLVIYFSNSVIVTILDICIVFVLYRCCGIDLVISNTIGVVTGFLVDYYLSKRFVFEMKQDVMDFMIYFLTFLLGLSIADYLIYFGNHILFSNMEPNMNFLFSKGLSVAGPFFILYFLRKFLYEKRKR